MPTTTTKKPKELDLNLAQMRIDAMSDLLATLHEKLKRFDDIDVLERVLNSQTPMIAAQAVVHTNGNGRNGHAVAEADEEPAPQPSKRVQHTSIRLNQPMLREAVAAILRAHPEGRTVAQLIANLRSNGVIPAQLRQEQAITAIRKPIGWALREQLIRRERANPRVHATYFMAGAPAPAAVPPAPGEAIPTDISIREAVTQAMLTFAPNASIRPAEIKARLLEHGWAKVYKGNPLINHVNWALVSMVGSGMAVRKNRGTFAAYVLRRPTLKVTKE